MKGSYQKTFEGYMLVNGRKNEVFYSNKKDNEITALSTYYKRKVKTERLLTTSIKKSIPVSKYITKITLL